MTFLPSSPLFRDRNFGLLWLAGLISVVGDWTLRIALPLEVLRLTHSAATMSVVVLAGLVAGIAAAPVAGVFIDRLDRRRILALVNAMQAVGLMPLLAVGSAARIWLAVMVAFAESALAQIAVPAEGALLPMLVGRERLASANSLTSVANFAARLAGPAAGGAVAAAAGLRGAAGLDALTFAAAAIACALIRGTYRPARAAHTPHARPGLTGWLGRIARDLADGIAALAVSRPARAVAAFIAVISVGEGMMSTLFAVWVIRAAHAGGRQMGWMLSAQAIGGILGSLAGPAAARRWPPVRLSCTCMVLFGAGDLVIFNAPRWYNGTWGLIALFFFIGIPAGVGYPPLLTLFQRSAPDSLRGRMLAVTGAAQAAASILGAAIAGMLGDHVGVIDLLTVQGAGYVLAAAVLRIMAGPGPRRVCEPTGQALARERRPARTPGPSS